MKKKTLFVLFDETQEESYENIRNYISEKINNIFRLPPWNPEDLEVGDIDLTNDLNELDGHKWKCIGIRTEKENGLERIATDIMLHAFVYKLAMYKPEIGFTED